MISRSMGHGTANTCPSVAPVLRADKGAVRRERTLEQGNSGVVGKPTRLPASGPATVRRVIRGLDPRMLASAPPTCRGRSCLHTGGGWAVIGMAWVLSAMVGAQPYTPRHDDEVLERLQPGTGGAEVRRQREELANDPENLRDSLDLARSYIVGFGTEGDRRFLDFARAVLGPWSGTVQAPPGVLALRGCIRLVEWEYDAALRDFREVLARDPENLEARRGAIAACLSRADFAEAGRLLGAWPSGVASLDRALCEARLGRMGNGLTEARARLAAALAQAGGTDPGRRSEVWILLADLALQAGDTASASTHFASCAALGHRDVATFEALTDWYLATKRSADVLALLAPESPLDSYVLRLAEAWQTVPPPDSREDDRRRVLIHQLEQRLQARRRRGDASGISLELRFRTRIRPDSAAARELARELWRVRRDLADVGWILRAADKALRAEVEVWLQRHQIQDVRLGEFGVGASGEVRP